MKKVMVITGTSRGLGRFLSDYYKDKYEVFGGSRHTGLDVRNPSDVKRFVDGVFRDKGRIDIVINNAGIASMNSCLTTSFEMVSKIIDTNFIGSFLMTRFASVKMIANRTHGQIVNISTVAVPLALAGESVYAASKAAVETFTQIVAKELAPLGIRVNCLRFGPLEGGLIEGVSQGTLDGIMKRQVVPRRVSFRDAAEGIDMILSYPNDMMSGHIFNVGC